MLDLPSPASVEFPAHWLAAAMPQAAICVLNDSGLAPIDTGMIVPVSISAALRDALIGTAAEALVTIDQTGAPWRLRRPRSAPLAHLWLLQSVQESRRLALQNFRGAAAAKLVNSLMHELRNPLNALGLQSDLLTRTLKPNADAAAIDVAAGRIAQMKERLRDLLERQNSMVGVWLSEPQDEAGAKLPVLVDETLRLLRSYGSTREVRVQADDLSALDGIALPAGSFALRMVLVVVLLLAIDSFDARAQAKDGAALELRAITNPSPSGTQVILEVRARFAPTALLGEWQIADVDEWLATLALLLDDARIELSYVAGRGLSFKFQATPAA